jgi:hypothetical protein
MISKIPIPAQEIIEGTWAVLAMQRLLLQVSEEKQPMKA